MMKFIHLIDRLNRCVVDNRMQLSQLEPLMREYYLRHDRKEINTYEYMLREDLKREQDYNKFIPYINQSFEINLIYWGKNATSMIHDHPENGCIATVMKGCLRERRYDSDHLNINKDKSEDQLQPTSKPSKSMYLHAGDVNYIAGHELHDITNCSTGYTPDGNGLSIHIYSPPNFYLPDNVINYNMLEGKLEVKELVDEGGCYAPNSQAPNLTL